MIPAADIEQAQAVPLLHVIEARGLRLRRQGAEWCGPCPVCVAGHDRFAINCRRGLWNCRHCGRGGGDAISLVQFLDGCDFPEAIATLIGTAKRKHASVSIKAPPQPELLTDDDVERLRRADAIWREAVPIANTSGADYLAGRPILLDDVPDHGGLRFHPTCPWEGATQPCIVARFTHAVTGAPLGIHRRPIALAGAKPKSLGPIAGGVVRLWPDDAITTGLVLGEGLETVLAAATAVLHKGVLLQPAWAAGSANNLEKFPVLPGIEALTILVDHDVSGRGQKAAHSCGMRWREAGREVALLVPRCVGWDFNDIVARAEP